MLLFPEGNGFLQQLSLVQFCSMHFAVKHSADNMMPNIMVLEGCQPVISQNKSVVTHSLFSGTAGMTAANRLALPGIGRCFCCKQASVACYRQMALLPTRSL